MREAESAVDSARTKAERRGAFAKILELAQRFETAARLDRKP
jgi:hypothetical protein